MKKGNKEKKIIDTGLEKKMRGMKMRIIICFGDTDKKRHFPYEKSKSAAVSSSLDLFFEF